MCLEVISGVTIWPAAWVFPPLFPLELERAIDRKVQVTVVPS